MLPSHAELTYFLEVAHTQNISRAAERLGITQPALSVAIRRVEDSLGLPVLVRGRSGVRLTRAGERFALQARGLIAEWEKLKGDALRDEREARGRYVIGCHPSVGLYSLPLCMPRLLEKHPALEVKLVHDLSRKIAEDVISFKVDFGIVVNPPKHPDLVIKPLFTDEVLLWVARGADASKIDTLICDPELVQTQKLSRELERTGLKFKRTVTSSSLEVITALTEAGAGAGLIPGRVARAAARTSKIRPWSDTGPKYPDRICLVYRADTQTSAASKAIVADLTASLRASEAN